jgi:hypothetical protein
MKYLKKQDDGFYSGTCELKGCHNKVISRIPQRKYCTECRLKQNHGGQFNFKMRSV